MEGDHLVINGTIYGLHDLHKLPPALSGYKAAQKEDDHTIAFMGGLSPYSNFHRSKFIINNHIPLLRTVDTVPKGHVV